VAAKRIAAIAAALTLALAIGACGGDEEPATTTEIATPVTTSDDVSETDQGSPARSEGEAKKPQKRARGKRAAQGGVGAGSSGEKSGQEPRPAPEGCPPGMTRAECEQLADAIAQGGKQNDACPAGLSEAECEAAAETIEGADDDPGPKASDRPEEECPSGLTEEQCRSFGAVLGSG
jgi:hypothetical protein